MKATRFSDVDGDHPQAAFIERFAALGITAGCSTVPLSYCPDGHVTRAQTATFLAHAYDPEAADPAGFTDVAVGGIHSADIDALFSAGITAGCATEPLRFCPQRATTRAQMASLLVRADDYAAERQAALESLNSESLSDNHNPPVGSDTPGGNDNPPVGSDTPRGNHNPPVGSDTPRGNHNPPVGSDTPRGDHNPPPPTITIIPPKDDEFLSQTAAGTPKVVRAITDKSVHNTNFQVYYPLAGTIVDPDGQTLTWNVIKPPEADWLVFDSAALTLSGHVPSSFAEGDSISITVKVTDTDAKAAEYSFSITSLGPYNPEPLGCRATGAPIATKDWIKIGNWEWVEPNHDPAIPENTPGYWQPDWVEEIGGSGKPKWNAPFITKDSRRVAGETEIWRMKEVEYYRITRSPAWDFSQIIVDVDDLQSFYGPDGNEVAISVSEGADIVPTSTQPRVDGLWTYTLSDVSQPAGAIYTIEASTCENGPWSRPLELQWKFPNAPTIRPEFTYLTRYGEDGNLLPDNDLALNIGWKYERGEFYEVRVDILDSEDNLLHNGLRYKFYDHLSQPGASWVERLKLTSIFQITADDNLAGSGKQIRIWLRVCKDRGLFALAPCSRNTELILSTKNYQGPKVAND